MRKRFTAFICLLLAACLLACMTACSGQKSGSETAAEETNAEEVATEETEKAEPAEEEVAAEEIEEPETFANGVTKLAKDLYTVTITEEYDVHSLDERVKAKYWNQEYADYYAEQYEDVVDEALKASGAACSGARYGNYAGRTYDWFYIDSPSVIVKTTATENRLASLACFSGAKDTKQLETEDVDIVYSMIADDGINEAGVVIQQNVLQLGNEVTTGTNPEGPDTLSLVVGRIVLDNAHNVDEAVELIKGLNIYATYSDLMIDETHWMISDPEKSVVVEIVDNEIVVTETNLITNFYVNNQYFDGTIDSLKENQPRAMGWRRYFLLQDGLEEVDSVEDMFEHMSKVFYWHAYDAEAEDYWYDEGYGLYDFDEDGEYEYFDLRNESDDNPVCKAYKEYYCGLGYMQELDNGTWFTEHTTIFDLSKKELTIVVDEQGFDTAVTFGFDF